MNKLYERDYYGWVQDQADALRRRSANEIDWDNLLEEVADLGRGLRDELRNRLTVLLAHLLKWRLQPTRRTRSWVLTVREQRRQVERLLRQNPSLQLVLGETFGEAYASAIDAAADETGLPDQAFAPEPPFTFDEAMSEPVEWPQD